MQDEQLSTSREFLLALSGGRLDLIKIHGHQKLGIGSSLGESAFE